MYSVSITGKVKFIILARNVEPNEAMVLYKYCKFGNFREDMRSFVKIRSSQNGEIILWSTYIGKSCPSREF